VKRFIISSLEGERRRHSGGKREKGKYYSIVAAAAITENDRGRGCRYLSCEDPIWESEGSPYWFLEPKQAPKHPSAKVDEKSR